MKVNIESLDHQGRGIARENNIPIFIPYTNVNDTLEIEITKTKKNYKEGKVIDYMGSNLNYDCPNYLKCGGCNIMHINYLEQLKYKENKVKEIMSKFADIDSSKIKKIIPNDNPFNYRNKVTFQVKNKIGYYQNKTSNIINIDNCMIADNKINNILNDVKKNVDLRNIYQIVIRTSKNTEDTMIVFKSNGQIDKDIVKNLTATSIINYNNKKYVTLSGKDYILEKLDDLIFKISPDSFFQVNTKQTEKLYNKVLEYSDLKKDDNVMDLYCGTGTIGIYLSRYCKSVYGVEINKYAVIDALENIKLNNIKNVNFECGDLEKLSKSLPNDIDIVVVDPPRSGLDKNTINYLNNIKPRKLIYVSCDPVTLARDIKLLDNYELLEITPVDMFSQTYHVECVSVLHRKKLEK